MKIFSALMASQCVLASLLVVGCGSDDKAAVESAPAAQQTAVAAVKTEVHPGKLLHDANCISCHDAGVYTREERKISDFPKLLAQVKRCDANLGSRLFDDEIEQVAAYLNQTYYKHDKE